jgi:hypothetical protein
MKARIALGVPLALALGAGCSFPTVSDAYRCEKTADCEAGRTCVEGFCVAPDEVDAGSGGGMDGPAGNPFDCKAWPAPRHFAPCDLPAPSAALVLDTGLFTYDTTAGTLTGAQPVTVASKLLPAGRVISVERITINAGATLRVVGAYPLIIASWGTLEVTGEIDASSAASPGAGANPSDCASHAAVVGGSSTAGASGGGGGGFQGAGGRGGNGGGGTPGNGGASVAAAPLLLGGCPGARGGNGDAQNAGAGGAGGGAVQLTAKQSITIAGRVHAGGAGGGGATGSDGAGGGGGAGGMIGLEAPAVTVTATGILAANGGGGGQGENTSPGGTGQPGAASLTAAAGGAGGDGGPGGAGSAGAILSGAQGQGSNDGAGGGGGGAGYITIRSGSRQLDGSARISPAATIVP